MECGQVNLLSLEDVHPRHDLLLTISQKSVKRLEDGTQKEAMKAI